MENGWIKIHRKLQLKGYYTKSQYVHLWVHLLLSANHKQAEYMTNGNIIFIKEGQLLTGRKQLSMGTGIPESTVEDILKLLEKEHQIQQQKTTKYRLITIVNWKEYQTSDNKATTGQQQADTNKNDKKEKSATVADAPDILEVQELPEAQPKKEIDAFTAHYAELCDWAEARRGFKFVARAKQYSALKKARLKEITPERMKKRWTEFENDDFYILNGFDWATVISSFDKRA